MKEQTVDYIIIGGGCSGLSLALELAKKDPHKSILILENRTQYLPDRTWCYWNVNPHPFQKQVQYQWKRWLVRYKQETLSLKSSKYAYQCIPSEYFYQEAVLQIKNSPHSTLLMNVNVTDLKEDRSKVVLETSQGKFSCRKVYDSRLERISAPLYQHFYGWQIETDRAIFDPLQVILMDFDVPQDYGLNFMYLLPFSSQSALIESTYISAKVLPKETYEEAIKKYLLMEYGLQSYQIVNKETGILPLQSFHKGHLSSRVIPIGTRAGWMRASTGYAFLSIQNEIKSLLDTLEPKKGKTFEKYLDRLFLSYVQQNPELSPELFFNLFKKNSVDRMVRFLTSSWSYYDLFHVIWSMPKFAMIKKALFT